MLKLTGTGFGNDVVCLVAEFCGEPPVRRKHLGGRKNLLFVASRMRCDLGRLMALKPVALHVGAYLLASRAGGIQVLLRVALDLRRSAAAGLDFVAEIAKSVHQFGLVDGSGKLLRLKEAARLEGAHRAVRAFGHIEDHGVRMELRRGVAIHRAGGVVLEFGGDELPCGFGRVVAADARLRVPLQFRQSRSHGLGDEPPHPLVAADKAVNETDLGAEKVASQPARCSIGGNGLSVTGRVLVRLAVPDKLLASCRDSGLGTAGQTPLHQRRQTARSYWQAAPATRPLSLSPAPIALVRGGELPGVIGLRLGRGERFGDGQHGILHPWKLRFRCSARSSLTGTSGSGVWPAEDALVLSSAALEGACFSSSDATG